MLRGVLPVLPTVFHKDGEIDKDGVRAVLEYVLDAGVDGVVFPGLASEYDYLTRKERAELVALVGEWVAGRVPFIVGASAQNQNEILEYASEGAKAGACAAMILSPHSLGDDRQAITAFFNRIGSSAGLSIMMQNAPRPMGTALDVDAICDIARGVDAKERFKDIVELVCGYAGAAIAHANQDRRIISAQLHRDFGAVGRVPNRIAHDVFYCMLK